MFLISHTDRLIPSIAAAAALLLILLIGPSARAGDTVYTVGYVGKVQWSGSHGSDCWGWTAPDNTEYALMGFQYGIGVVQTTPSIQKIDSVPGPVGAGGYIWRDIKTYQHYAYTVSEASGEFSGVSVIDLQYLPDSLHYIGSFSTNGGTGYTSHNISIDTARAYAYIEGNTSEKIRIMDLSNPELPVYMNSFGTSDGQVHDFVAFNDTVYVAEGNPGTWSIWDLSNKFSPQLLVRVAIPNAGYVHNIWPSPDRHYCVTTEETVGKTMKIWDISDYSDIKLVSQWLEPSHLAHNAFWRGNVLVASHYESGITFVDESDPTAPSQIYRYDTYPAGESGNFNGCWGAFPFTQNGYAYASSIEGSLVVLHLDAECPKALTPGLISPEDGVTGLPQPATLNWVSNAAPYYRVQVDDDPAFGSPEYDVTDTASSLVVSGLAEYTTFYWRVNPVNDCGEGIWSPTRSFTTTCIVPLTGDVDQSLTVTSSDVIYMVNHVFKGGPEPLPIAAAGDVDCSGTLTSGDIIAMVNYVFKSTPLPCDVCSVL